MDALSSLLAAFCSATLETDSSEVGDGFLELGKAAEVGASSGKAARPRVVARKANSSSSFAIAARDF